MRLEEAVELLPDEGGPELLVMELATGGERTIDGIASGGRIVLGHPKTRESMRAGLAMYFETLADADLMDVAGRIVAELELDHFFNIQLVGEQVIEVNPRISTIVYQDDLNIPYLGIKHALGEISDDDLAAYASRIRPGRVALRYFDQLEWDPE
jgi:ATP-grasp domain-containing protein